MKALKYGVAFAVSDLLPLTRAWRQSGRHQIRINREVDNDTEQSFHLMVGSCPRLTLRLTTQEFDQNGKFVWTKSLNLKQDDEELEILLFKDNPAVWRLNGREVSPSDFQANSLG